MAAPVVSSHSVSSIEAVQADLLLTITGTGEYAVAVLPFASSAPSASDVLAGTATGAVFELIEQTVVTGVQKQVILTPLVPGTAYKVYIATDDTSGGTAVSSGTAFTMLSGNPNPVIRQQQTPTFVVSGIYP